MSRPSDIPSGFLKQLARHGGNALSAVLNRVIHLDPESRNQLETLEGKRLRLDLTGTAQSIGVTIEDRQIHLRALEESEMTPEAWQADTVVSGRPGDLFAAAAPEWGHSQSGVTIQGDTALARKLQKLFQQLDPDWEAPLARALGDVDGHQVDSALRAGRAWFDHAGRSTAAAARDYVRHESEQMVTAAEFNAFSREVEDTRDEVDRAAARLNRLEANRKP